MYIFSEILLEIDILHVVQFVPEKPAAQIHEYVFVDLKNWHIPLFWQGLL